MCCFGMLSNAHLYSAVCLMLEVALNKVTGLVMCNKSKKNMRCVRWSQRWPVQLPSSACTSCLRPFWLCDLLWACDFVLFPPPLRRTFQEVRARNLTPQPELEEWRKNYTNARSSSHSISLPAIKVPSLSDSTAYRLVLAMPLFFDTALVTFVLVLRSQLRTSALWPFVCKLCPWKWQSLICTLEF